MGALYAVAAVAALVGVGAGPLVGAAMARAASGLASAPGRRWRLLVRAFEGAAGAGAVLLVVGLTLPAGHPLVAAWATVAAQAAGVQRQLDAVDDAATLARAVGRATGDPRRVEEGWKGRAVGWAYRLGATARLLGGALAAGAVTAVHVAG